MFDYFYGDESENFVFYRIPKKLFTDEYYKRLSTDARLLYGMMLDRMRLSVKNHWIDCNRHVYIIFTVEHIKECFHCHEQKANKLLRELDTEHGIGLIEKKRQGQGKPNLIYVKNFASLNCENHHSAPVIIKKEELRKSQRNDNNLNYIEKQPSIAAIKEQIEYEILIQEYSKECVDDLIMIVDEVMHTRKKWILGIPIEKMQNQYRKLNRYHVSYVIDSLEHYHHEIKNIKNYFLMCLYNSVSTIHLYYKVKTNLDDSENNSLL